MITPITRAQREALFRVFQRDFPGWITPTTRHEGTYCPHCQRWSGGIVKVPSLQWRRFRKTAQPGFGIPCIMLPWAGMWLGIERDGYCHS
jgi:hypothetical protein